MAQTDLLVSCVACKQHRRSGLGLGWASYFGGAGGWVVVVVAALVLGLAGRTGGEAGGSQVGEVVPKEVPEVVAGFGHSGKSENNGCTAVKMAYYTKGLASHRDDVPTKMVSGWYLRICPQGFTCCTEQMELKLSTQSRQEYDKKLGEKIDLVRQTFISRTAKFDAFFTELLDAAKRDLHTMFVQTYGLLYQQNSHVFTDLFRDLRNYYRGQDLNLLDVLDNFFSTLLRKMFELLNSQYTFDENYLSCVTDHMEELKPFGDVPQKLSIQVKRAFVAARTFVQGLAIGRDVVLAVSKLDPSQSCTRSTMKMLYCPYCKGLANVKPCNNYCMNVMKGCLAHHSELNAAWNSYLDELLKVADRLEGPFNIENVVDPIDVQISDGIMNFQENTEKVTYKVFQGCGQPRLGRKKRDAGFTPDFTKRNKHGHSTKHSGSGTSLDRLIRDIKKKITPTKDFWTGLPHAVCNDLAAPLDESKDCWNGLGKYKYEPDVTGDGLTAQINNPEVDVDVRRPNTVISQQVLQLKLMTNKLKNAYNGLDVDWIDSADIGVDDDGSGSGSGSGSGFGPYRPGTDDISFRQPTPPGPVIRTRRPPQSKPDDNRNLQTWAPRPGSTAPHVATSTTLALILPLCVVILSLWRR